MKTILRVSVDADVKEKAEILANQLGLTVAVVVQTYLERMILTGVFCVDREGVSNRVVYDTLTRLSLKARKSNKVA